MCMLFELDGIFFICNSVCVCCLTSVHCVYRGVFISVFSVFIHYLGHTIHRIPQVGVLRPGKQMVSGHHKEQENVTKTSSVNLLG